MTIIFQDGNEFWIESFNVNHGSIAATTLAILTVNLERPGRVVGVSDNLVYTSMVANQAQAGVFRPVIGDELIYGTFVDSFRSLVRNNGATGITFAVHQVILHLRSR